MSRHDDRNPGAFLAAFCALTLFAATSIWVPLPRSLALAGFGIVSLLASYAVGRREKRSGAQQEAASAKASLEVVAPVLRSDPTPANDHSVVNGQRRILNAFTIDLEDYFHTQVASAVVSAASWEHMPSCVEHSTMHLLDLLDRTDTRATVFVLGWVARKYPSLVRRISERGHTLGCHSDRHRLVYTLTPDEFLDDTYRALDSIRQASGARVQGYRAPSFSITQGAEWAFDILVELGFTYDSSVYPIAHPTYGNPQAMRFPYYVADCRLLEIPIATWKAFGVNLPVGGGAYLRILPERFLRAGVRAINRTDREPATIYVHPWEIDATQPRLELGWRSQLRQTIGLRTMEGRLERLLRAESFAPIEQVYADLIPQWHSQLIEQRSMLPALPRELIGARP